MNSLNKILAKFNLPHGYIAPEITEERRAAFRRELANWNEYPIPDTSEDKHDRLLDKYKSDIVVSDSLTQVHDENHTGFDI